MNRFLVRLFGSFTVFCLGLILSVGAMAQSAEKIKVRMDWTPWGGQAALHLAQQKGWFAASGLDVSLEDGNGSVTTIQIVGGGEQFDVGHAALASMMIARDKGLPVKAIAVFARLSDIGLLVPKDSGINGPKDLKGKKVIYTAGSLEAPFIDAFLASGGLKRGDLELINVDAASKASSYAVGRADAAFSTIPFFLPVVSQSRASEAIRFADYNLNMPSFGLFATESKLASKRESISKFASIVAASWQYIYNGHESEAADAMIAQRPQAKLDKAILRAQIEALKGFFQLPAPSGQLLGAPIEADFVTAVKTLTDVGLIKTLKDGKEFFAPNLVRPAAAVPK